MKIETRAQYRDLAARIEAGEPVARSTYEAMVAFAKEKRIKRPSEPVEFFEEQPAGDKPLTRKQCNARLAELGYTGPTSYLMPVLRDVVVYVETMHTMDDALGEAQGRLPEAVVDAIHGSGAQDEATVADKQDA